MKAGRPADMDVVEPRIAIFRYTVEPHGINRKVHERMTSSFRGIYPGIAYRNFISFLVASGNTALFKRWTQGAKNPVHKKRRNPISRMKLLGRAKQT